MCCSSTVLLANLIAVILAQSITFNSPKQEDYKTTCTRGVLINDTLIINSIVNFTNVNDVENVTYAVFQIQERGNVETKLLFFQNLQVPCVNSEHNSYKCGKVDENVVQFSFKLVAFPSYINATVIGTLQVKSTKISKAVMDFPALFETIGVKGVLSVNGHSYTTDDCRINTTSSDLHIQFACISAVKPCRIEMVLNGSRHINASDYVETKVTLDDEQFIHIHINYAACTLEQKIKHFNCVVRLGLLTSLKEDNELGIIIGSVFSAAILIGAIIFAIFWKRRKKWKSSCFSCLESNDQKIRQAGECELLTGQENTTVNPLKKKSKKGNKTTKNFDWITLYDASEKGQKDIVELLIKNQANVNEKTTLGYTALYVASQNGHKDIVKFLIKNQANVNEKTKTGSTALYIASQNGHKDIVEFLIKNQANVNEKTTGGYTALYVASHNGHKDIVELLIKNQANVNKKATDGATALYVASHNGHKDIVELLIK
ncbi:unnamed protein product, partial [Lymnaea stagnalis]